MVSNKNKRTRCIKVGNGPLNYDGATVGMQFQQSEDQKKLVALLKCQCLQEKGNNFPLLSLSEICFTSKIPHETVWYEEKFFV